MHANLHRHHRVRTGRGSGSLLLLISVPDSIACAAGDERDGHNAGNRYTYNQIKNDLVGKDGKADAATKLETDYLAQILLPSIKAQN